MPKIAEPITSLEQELELRIEWLENGLKEIQNKIASEGTKFVDVRELLNITVAYLDGEPTTADKHNIVRISDINKEIAIDWKNRKREEAINKKKTK